MSMPFDCDATLPQASRYASLKFRRFAPTMQDLQWGDAAELVAFVGVVGVRASRWIFHWDAGSYAYAKALVAGLGSDVDVVKMVEENRAAVTLDDGLGVLRAMQDGGWSQGGCPPVVRMALLEMRDRGLSQPRIARELGLTLDQVRNMANGIRAGRESGRRGRAASLLAVG